MVNVAAGTSWLAGAPLYFHVWAADKLWPLPLNEGPKYPARVVAAHDGTPLWRFADAVGIWRYPVTIKEALPATGGLNHYEDRPAHRVNLFFSISARGMAGSRRARYFRGSTLDGAGGETVDPHSRTFGGKIRRALQLEWYGLISCDAVI